MSRPSFSDLRACILGTDLFARVQCIGFPRGTRCTNCIPVHLIDVAETRFSKGPDELTERHVRDILSCLLCDRPTCGLNTSREVRAYQRHWFQELCHMDFSINRRPSEYSISHGWTARNKAARARPSDSAESSDAASTPHPKNLQADVYEIPKQPTTWNVTGDTVVLRIPTTSRSLPKTNAESSTGRIGDISSVRKDVKRPRDARFGKILSSSQIVIKSVGEDQSSSPPRTPPSQVNSPPSLSSSADWSTASSSEHLLRPTCYELPAAAPLWNSSSVHTHRAGSPDIGLIELPAGSLHDKTDDSASSEDQTPAISLLQRLTTAPPPRRRKPRTPRRLASAHQLTDRFPLESNDAQQSHSKETPISPLQDWEKEALEQSSRSGTPPIVSPRIPVTPFLDGKVVCPPLPLQNVLDFRPPTLGSSPEKNSVKSFEIHVAPVVADAGVAHSSRRHALCADPSTRPLPDLPSAASRPIRGSLSPKPSPLHQVALSIDSSDSAEVSRSHRRIASSQDLYQLRLEELAVATFEPSGQDFPKPSQVWVMFRSMVKGYTKGAVSTIFCPRRA